MSGAMQRSLANGPKPNRPCSLACGIPGCRLTRVLGTTTIRLLQLHTRIQDSIYGLHTPEAYVGQAWWLIQNMAPGT
jgi:hypothetical protein